MGGRDGWTCNLKKFYEFFNLRKYAKFKMGGRLSENIKIMSVIRVSV